VIFLLMLTISLIVPTACTPASSTVSNAVSEPETTARRLLHDLHQDGAKLTRTVKGDPKTHNADELWCVQTDQMVVGGNLPLLFVIWRIGSTYQGDQLYEGFYDWDAQGCPR